MAQEAGLGWSGGSWACAGGVSSRQPPTTCSPAHCPHLIPLPSTGMLMVCIVIGARRLGINPDNIATPIAASLGDLITLSLLAFVSSFFYKHRGRAQGQGLWGRVRPGVTGQVRVAPKVPPAFPPCWGTNHSRQFPPPAGAQEEVREGLSWLGCFSASLGRAFHARHVAAAQE